MTYREAKKVKCGSTLLRKSQNYKPTSVLEIIEDKDTHAIFFRCTDGLFYHDALCMPMPAEKLADIYLKSRILKCILITIKKLVNGYIVWWWQFMTLWLASFDTEQEAQDYIRQHNLKIVPC